jgi:hypothetical protein
VASITANNDIPETSVSGWYQKWTSNGDWRPDAPGAQAMDNRVFSVEAEKTLYKCILDVCIKQGLLPIGSNFRLMVIATYDNWHAIDVDAPSVTVKYFQSLNMFISPFNKCNQFCCRLSHFLVPDGIENVGKRKGNASASIISAMQTNTSTENFSKAAEGKSARKWPIWTTENLSRIHSLRFH